MAMPGNGEALSLWAATAPPAPDAPPLKGDITTDVAIVGGGFTGLSTALHLAEQGIAAVVLEARDIGYGGSGRNAGLVNPGLWLDPDTIVALLGEERGERLNSAFDRSPDLVFDMVERHAIACEATRAGTIYLAPHEKALTKLAGRAEQMRARGLDVTILGTDETISRTGTRLYVGGLFNPRGGTVNPMGYVRGLARAALAAGAVIHCGSPALSLRREGACWSIETPGGTVRAGRVVIATNAYTDDLVPGLKQELVPFYYLQFATEPLGNNARATILPGGLGAWDARQIMHSFRLDAAGRLIVGTVGRLPDRGSGFHEAWARRIVSRLFPHLGPQRFEYCWYGQIAMTLDHLPRLHRPEEGLIACVGYNGRGIGPGTVMGKAIAEHLAGGPADALPLPFTEVEHAPLRDLRSTFYETAARVYHLGQLVR